MRSFNSTLEHLALTLTRVGYIDQACDVVAVIFRAEIISMPFARTSLERFLRGEDLTAKPITDADLSKLVRLMIRDLQRWAAGIIAECGLHAQDVEHDSLQTFHPQHALLVMGAWEAQPTAPVWRAFDRAVRSMWPRATGRNVPCDACEKNAAGIQAGKCAYDNATACIGAIAERKAS